MAWWKKRRGCEGCAIRDRNLAAEHRRADLFERLWLRARHELASLNRLAARYAERRRRWRGLTNSGYASGSRANEAMWQHCVLDNAQARAWWEARRGERPVHSFTASDASAMVRSLFHDVEQLVEESAQRAARIEQLVDEVARRAVVRGSVR